MYWRLLLCIVGALAYDWQMYEGYKVMNFWPANRKHIDIVKSFSYREGVSVWKEPRIGDRADYFIAENQYQPFIDLMTRHGIKYEDSNIDITADLKEEWDRMLARGYPGKMDYDPADYNERADIEAEMDRLAGLCAGVGLTCQTYFLPGTTHDGNSIKMLEIRGGATPRNSIQWESLIHCREWISGATFMNIIDRMITQYKTDPEATFLVDNYDFYMIPIMNPDGYDYTWNNERFWRKNRRDNEGSTCFGVDLNRNYDNNWSDPGADGSPCSDTYYGPSAGSEPETQAVVNHIRNHTGLPFIMDVSHHSYGHYLLTPYGNGTTPPGEDNTKLVEVTRDGCDAIQQTNNDAIWRCGNSMDVLYATSGGSTDWMMEQAGMKFTYVPELRGNSFSIPASEIPLSVAEIWNGLYAMVTKISSYPTPK